MKRIIALIIAILSCLSFTAACGGNNATPPDYSSSTKKLNMFAYCPPLGKNKMIINGDVFPTDEFRTKERYKEYKDCGFDILLLDGNNAYYGGALDANETFETSWLKKQLDWAEELGLKVIVYDGRIYWLSNVKGTSLIGTDFNAPPLPKKRFETFDDLVEHMRDCLSDYMDHPAFYGVTLFDEPEYGKMVANGEVYRAIKAVDPDIKVHSELSSFLWSNPKNYYTGTGGGDSTFNEYEIYLDKFLETSGSSYIDYDNYPLLINTREQVPFRLNSFVKNLQMVNNKVKTKDPVNGGWTLTIASSDCVMPANSMRPLTIRDLRWEASMGLAFGADNLSYYTYWEFPSQTLTVYPTQQIINRYGEKQLYNDVQKVNGELQNLAKVLLNYDYVGTAYAYDEIYQIFPMDLISWPEFELDVEDLKNITEIKASQHTLINEMYDADKEIYGYMVINGVDPVNNISDEITLTFEKKFSNVMVINRGETKTYSLKGGEYEFTLESGDSAFVIPY